MLPMLTTMVAQNSMIVIRISFIVVSYCFVMPATCVIRMTLTVSLNVRSAVLKISSSLCGELLLVMIEAITVVMAANAMNGSCPLTDSSIFLVADFMAIRSRFACSSIFPLQCFASEIANADRSTFTFNLL